MTNLFLPSVKLSNKIRIGSRIKRVYGAAKTPLDRLHDSGMGDRKKIEALYELRRKLDPFDLSRRVEEKLAKIWKLASYARPAAEKLPARRLAMVEQDNYPPLCVLSHLGLPDELPKMKPAPKTCGPPDEDCQLCPGADLYDNISPPSPED